MRLCRGEAGNSIGAHTSLVRESPALSAMYVRKDTLQYVRVDFSLHDDIYSPHIADGMGELWVLWELPELLACLDGFSPEEALKLSVSFSVLCDGEQNSPEVDFCLLQGDPGREDFSAFHKVDAQCFVHSSSGVAVGLLHIARPAFARKAHLAVRIKNASSRLNFRAPDVVWLDEERAGADPYVLHVSSCAVEDFTLKAKGWAYDACRPGFPVRLALLVNGQERDSCLARTEPDAQDVYTPQGAYTFEISCLLSDAERKPRVEIAVPDDQERFSFTTGALFVEEAAHNTSALPASPLPLPSNAYILGNVDAASPEGVTGWALSKKHPDSAIDLELFLDGKPFAHTQCMGARADVQKVHGGDGYAGFHFEVPPNAVLVAPVSYRVQPCKGRAKINKQTGEIRPAPMPFVGSELAVDRGYSALPSPSSPSAQSSLQGPAKLSVIIVNQNGAHILDEMLRSAENINDYLGIEWIVVDHQSRDHSFAVCMDARKRGFDLHCFPRNGNFSFSDSNNYGASRAGGDLLVFANNDLLFVEPFSEAIRGYLSDPHIGVLGVKLLDHIPGAPDWTGAPVQHLGVFFNAVQARNCLRPYEARLVEEIRGMEERASLAPCVTAAFMAMRRDDFARVGGFDANYIYGLEDVDLCLKVRQGLAKAVVCANDLTVVHRRGFSRKHQSHEVIRRNNNRQLNQTWAAYLRNNIRRDVFHNPGFWTGSRPVVGFIVSAAGDATSAGEYYTALEFGRALQKLLPVHLRFIPKAHWYDLQGVDVLIVMVKPFDLNKVKRAGPYLVTVNWMRQWFDAWADDPSLYAYDYLFASSEKAAEYITRKTGRKVDVLRIAANAEAFVSGRFTAEFSCDYCFTGSFFKLAREIQFALVPETIEGKGIVYGYNWEGTAFEPISRGPVPYSRLPDVYASTKIVLDDANIATKAWGSCNSRVFDSLAAGCLLVTNGADGVAEIFGDLAPTFHDQASLRQTLHYWLTHEKERRDRVEQLRAIVLREHTYANRAQCFIEVLEQRPRPVRVAIKCAAQFSARALWGDYHFAEALAAQLRAKGYVVRVNCREQWDSGLADADDVVIVLRGLYAYKPRMHQKSIMWLISHPTDVSMSELLEYDHVYCASAYHAELLSACSGNPVEYLPQCVDTDRFRFLPERIHARPDRILFVGNSRGVFRNVVRWAVEKDLDVDIYGAGWEPFLKDHRLKGQLLPNEVLAEAYASSKYVLCDHWEDMKRLGYVSNRVLDVLAVGGKLVLDDVRGIGELVPSGYEIFTNAAEYKELLSSPASVNLEERKKLAEWVAQEHSFAARAERVDARIRQLLQEPDSLLPRSLFKGEERSLVHECPCPA